MSYRNIQVNSTAPNSSNDIDIDSTNLLNTGRAGINCVLRKTSTGWGSPSCLKSYAGHLNFEVDTHSGSTTYRYDVEDNYCSRKVGGEYDLALNITFENTDLSYAPMTNSSWTKSYLFNGTAFNNKKVLLKAVIGPSRTSSNSYYTIQWMTGNPDQGLSFSSPLGPMSYGHDQYGSVCYGLYTGSGTDEYISIRFIDVKDCALTTGVPASIQSITARIIE